MDEIRLTEDQKSKILTKWESSPSSPPSLLDLIQSAFSDKNVDGRSKEGRAVKAFLASQKIEAHGAQNYQPVQERLTEDDKEFIVNNRELMSDVEMARVIRNDNSITNLHKITKLVSEYNNSLGSLSSLEVNDSNNLSKYKPPRTFNSALTKINKYILDGINKDKISGSDRKGIGSLLKYLDTYRFNHQINSYDTQTERDLYESSFVRYTYNKSDLSQEEVDQYIVLSTEVVIASNIQRRIRRLSTLLDNVADDTEGRRMSMSLVDAISGSQTEYNQCVNRQQKLLESLKEKRSDRLKKQIKENASILNLVQLWKEEESRKKMIKLARIRKESIKKEIDNLTTMDEMKARVLGISEDEVLNG